MKINPKYGITRCPLGWEKAMQTASAGKNAEKQVQVRPQCGCCSRRQEDRSTSKASSFTEQKSQALFKVMKMRQVTKLQPAEVWSNHRGKQKRAFSGNRKMSTFLTLFILPTTLPCRILHHDKNVPCLCCPLSEPSSACATGSGSVVNVTKEVMFITCDFNLDSHMLLADCLSQSKDNRCT